MVKQSAVIYGSERQPISIDFYYNTEFKKVPLVIYAHGFCGFKDWGNIGLVAQEFLDAGLAFACFNFSHNGTSLDAPEDFVRLDLFAENNFTKQLFDFEMVLDFFALSCTEWQGFYEKEQIGIIGHSMGGGIALLTSIENKIVKALCTWASVIDCNTPFGTWDEAKMILWKNVGTAYYHNGRTKQDLPMNYQLVEDADQNKIRLNIRERIKDLNKPVLICHGSEDSSVPVSAAHYLKENICSSELITVASDHVFGRQHPAISEDLPFPMRTVVTGTIKFFKENLA